MEEYLIRKYDENILHIVTWIYFMELIDSNKSTF